MRCVEETGRDEGYTLIELLITLALFAFISTMSCHTFAQLQNRKKQETTLISVFHALQYARQEAIYRNEQVHVGPLSGSCTAAWHEGLEIFIAEHFSKNKISLRVFQNPTSNNTITSNQPCGFTFQNDGRCTTPGTIVFDSHKIVINDSGRPRIVYPQ